jgi:hypothetical protein
MSTEARREDPYMRVTVDIRLSTLVWLDGLRDQLGVRSRGAVLNRLLEELAGTSNR